MNQSLPISCLLVLFLSFGNDGLSQEKKPTSKTDAASVPAELSNTQLSFKDLVCARAADFDCGFQNDAISIVRQHGFVDERFNAAIYRVMKDSLHEDNLPTENLSRALRLLPSSTLEAKIQAKLVFECYLKSAVVVQQLKLEGRSSRRAGDLVKELTAFLKSHPIELTELLKDGLEHDHLPPAGYALVQHSTGMGLSGLVVNRIGSEDPVVALAAMLAANTIIKRVASKNELVPAGSLQDKYIRYAERLIGRYDVNKDGQLSQSEGAKMLMSPNPADANRDGLVSVNEYAYYLQARGKQSP